MLLHKDIWLCLVGRGMEYDAAPEDPRKRGPEMWDCLINMKLMLLLTAEWSFRWTVLMQNFRLKGLKMGGLCIQPIHDDSKNVVIVVLCFS